MKKLFNNKGAALVEYAVLLSFVSAIGLSFMSSNGLGSSINGAVSKASNAINMILGLNEFNEEAFKKALQGLLDSEYKSVCYDHGGKHTSLGSLFEKDQTFIDNDAAYQRSLENSKKFADECLSKINFGDVPLDSWRFLNEGELKGEKYAYLIWTDSNWESGGFLDNKNSKTACMYARIDKTDKTVSYGVAYTNPVYVHGMDGTMHRAVTEGCGMVNISQGGNGTIKIDDVWVGDNNKAYKSTTFVDHNGYHITKPYIYDSYAPKKATLLWQDAPELVTNCSLIKEDNKNKYLKFEVSSDNIDQGNAVIAVQDVNGTTLWSWHIWVTDHDLSSTIAVMNETGHTANFMPVPLGWCDGSTGASKEYTVNFSQTTSGSTLDRTISQGASQITAGNAPFYQWGRKDPFVGSTGGSDNKTKTSYDGSGNPITTNPVTTTTRSRAESIKNPEKFILVPGGKFNWDANITYDNWNANVTGKPTNDTDAYNDNAVEKTVYDPSPVGFKMPTTNAFTGFGSGSTVNCEDSWDSGYKFNTGLSSPNPISIYFRANGFRSYNGGSLDGVTASGFYWASGPYSYVADGCLLGFYQGGVLPQYNNIRAHGFSVRPVSE